MPTIKERFAPPVHEVPSHKYLTHPLGSHDHEVTEGFIYSPFERSLHGIYYHLGVDYEAPYSAPVYAAADGYAVAFYHRFTLVDFKSHGFRLLDGEPMGVGPDIHLHFEEGGRRTIESGISIKVQHRDPYGIYLTQRHYNNIETPAEEILFSDF